MKTALFSIMFGPDPMFRYSRYSFERYADRIGAELVVWRDLHDRLPELPRDVFKLVNLQKLFMDVLFERFDRILYLDGDVIIQPDAPDVFAAFPDPEPIYLFDEGQYADRSAELERSAKALGSVDAWPMNESRRVYYNAGVMLVSRGCRLFECWRREDLVRVCSELRLGEQTYLNYLVVRHGVPVCGLPGLYNRMEIAGDHEHRLESHFVHYAGSGFGKRRRHRARTLFRDTVSVYPELDNLGERLRFRRDYWHWRLARATRDVRRWLSGGA